MKKIIVVLLVVCILFSAAGCSVLNDASSIIKPTETVFSVDLYHLQITADSTFQEKTGGSFDLQITNNNAYISVMAYKYIDLSEDLTPLKVYDMQNKDLFSRRSAVTVIEEETTQSLGKYVVKQALHSAEKDGIKNYYGTYLVDFPEQKTFAWVLITAMPSYFENNREYLQNIAYSLVPVE